MFLPWLYPISVFPNGQHKIQLYVIMMSSSQLSKSYCHHHHYRNSLLASAKDFGKRKHNLPTMALFVRWFYYISPSSILEFSCANVNNTMSVNWLVFIGKARLTLPLIHRLFLIGELFSSSSFISNIHCINVEIFFFIANAI